MNTDLLTQLAQANSEEERAWIVTQALIATLPSELQAMVWAAAVPHWFDAAILAALRPELADKSEYWYGELQNLSFVEVFPERGHNIHEHTRRLILQHLPQEQPDEFCGLSARAAAFFSQQEGTENTIESIYHLLVAEPEQGADAFRHFLDTEWNGSFRYAELEALVNVLSEHLESNQILRRARTMIWGRMGGNLPDDQQATVKGNLSDDQQATVNAIFEDPPRSDIPWFKVLNIFETLVKTLGGITDRFGDFICIGLGPKAEIGGVFPCLSDQEYVDRQMIGYLRGYLSGVGVEPR